MIYSVQQATEKNAGIRDLILGKVTQYEIFCYYLGYAFIPNRVFNSPFRKDNKPSFGIFHADATTLLYKDLGNPNYVGDCFNFVAQMSSPELTYQEALFKVYKDLLLGRIRNTNIKLPVIYSGGKETRLRKQIKYVPVEVLSPLHKKYWEDIGILESDWNFFKLAAADEVYVDDILSWTSSIDNPIFIYKTFSRIKGYRPLEHFSTRKWISNTSRYDIQGWEQLPEFNTADTLIITKSMKDVMTLRKLGYLAIAPSSESVLIPPEAMKILKRDFGFRYFIVMYDRDDGGMKGARKMMVRYRGEYNMNFVFLPKGLPKDVSQIRREYGKHRTTSLLKRLLNYEPSEQISVVS